MSGRIKIATVVGQDITVSCCVATEGAKWVNVNITTPQEVGDNVRVPPQAITLPLNRDDITELIDLLVKIRAPLVGTL